MSVNFVRPLGFSVVTALAVGVLFYVLSVSKGVVSAAYTVNIGTWVRCSCSYWRWLSGWRCGWVAGEKRWVNKGKEMIMSFAVFCSIPDIFS